MAILILRKEGSKIGAKGDSESIWYIFTRELPGPTKNDNSVYKNKNLIIQSTVC